MTFKGEEEEYTKKLITIDFMRFIEIKKIINVLGYGRSVLTVKLQPVQVIENLIVD